MELHTLDLEHHDFSALTKVFIIDFDNVNSSRDFITPRGIRIPVTSVKGKCPRPLDDGG